MTFNHSDDCAGLTTRHYEFYYGWDALYEYKEIDDDNEEDTWGFYVRNLASKDIVLYIPDSEIPGDPNECGDSLLLGIGKWLEREGF